MALTKVREVVSDIARISDGTSNVEVLSSGGNVAVDVGGVEVVTASPTTITINSLVDLVADLIIARAAQLTGSGVTGEVDAGTGSRMTIGTTSAHPVAVKANNVDALTVDTSGRVTLGVQGNSAAHLVNKSYIDGLITVTAAAQANTLVAANGSQTIVGSGGNTIVKWGTATTTAPTDVVVTFTAAFPNAFFVATCTPTANIDGNSDGWFRIHSASTAGFTISPANRSGSETFYWIAIGN